MQDGRKARRAAVVLLALALVLGFATAARAAPWTSLEKGRSGAYRFAVEAKRGGAGLCLRVSVLHWHGPFSFDRGRFRSCIGPGAGLRARSAPLFAGGAQLGRAPGSGLSVFAALFAPSVRSAWIGLEEGGAGIPVPRLEPSEAGSLGLERAGIGVVVVDGASCAKRALSRSAGGAVLWESGTGLGCGGFEEALEP
jgi:hypothetical protein